MSDGGRLVHDEDASVGADRLGDLDDLLLRHAERLRQPIGIDARRRPARGALSNAAAARRPIDTAPAVTALERQRDVLGDREIGKERRLLIDRRDAEGTRRVRIDDARTSRPPTASVPASARSAPVMILISVDLPAPFSPTSACTSPARSSNETSFQGADARERFADADGLEVRSAPRVLRRVDTLLGHSAEST